MEQQILRPRRNVLRMNGRLTYSEGIGAWNMVRFKKELINEFPQLKEKISKFGYDLAFYQDYKGLEKAIRKLKRKKEALPLLMWLVKEKGN